jgi:penicillin-binding protein 1A
MEMAQPAKKAKPPKQRLARGTAPAVRTLKYVPGAIAGSIFLVFLLVTNFHSPHKFTLAVALACAGIGGALWWIGKRGGGWTWMRLLKWGALSIFVSAALAFAGAAGIIWYYSRELPSIDKLSDYHPKQVTVVLDDKGQRIGEVMSTTGERRTFVPFAKIPKRVVNAFLAAEDEHFWTHGGVDYTAIVRAVWNDMRGGSMQGASTITQQVVKNMILTKEQTFKRKIQEMILARRLEKNLTKEEILTLYLNEIYFGQQRYGVVEAARYYFGKELDQLDVGEAAVLGGMPKEPETFSNGLRENATKKQIDAIKDRQVHVLNREAELGFITADEAKQFINQPIQVVKRPFPALGSAPEWVEHARTELAALHPPAELDTLGATVKTTMSSEMQANAQKALQEGLRAYDARHKLGQPLRKIDPNAMEKELAKLAKKLPKGGPVEKETYEAIVTRVRDADHEVDVDLGDWPATMVFGADDDRYNPPDDKGVVKTLAERFPVGGVFTVMRTNAKLVHGDHAVRIPPGPQGAVVVIEVKTRKVRALVGGYNLKPGDLDRATQAERQPGSSFKPFVYAAAFDTGQFTPASIVNDAPDVYNLYKPHNYEQSFEGPVRLRTALAKSINTVAIRVTAQLTPKAVVDYAHKVGITEQLPEALSVSLGAGDVTPLDMTNAIATFAAGGKWAPPRFIDSIDGVEPKVADAEQRIRPEVAYVVTDMMRSVVEEGTGVRAKALGIPIYGKTGTSSDEKDAWFIGMTPDWVVGVWIGYDQPRTLGGREQGGVTAVPVFVSLVKTMKLPAKKFAPPPGVTSAVIDKTTGLLAADGAPADSKLTEVFIKGTEPKDTAPLPGEQTTNTFVTSEYDDDGKPSGAGAGSGSGSGAGSGSGSPDVLEAGHGSGNDDAEPRTTP